MTKFFRALYLFSSHLQCLTETQRLNKALREDREDSQLNFDDKKRHYSFEMSRNSTSCFLPLWFFSKEYKTSFIESVKNIIQFQSRKHPEIFCSVEFQFSNQSTSISSNLKVSNLKGRARLSYRSSKFKWPCLPNVKKWFYKHARQKIQWINHYLVWWGQIQPGRDLITDPLSETCTCKCKMGLNARAALPYYCKNVS